MQGWDFEKSKFKIKLSNKFDNLIFFVFLKHDYFCLYLRNKVPSYQFSNKNENRPPLMVHVIVFSSLVIIHLFIYENNTLLIEPVKNYAQS